MQESGGKKRVIVVGGGFGGAYAAQRLSRRLPEGWDLLLIDRNNFLLFYPLLVEASVGSLEARHVVVPLRRFLKRGEVVMAEVRSIDPERRTIEIQVIGADKGSTCSYDELILACGSITKLPPVPGLKEYGFELKSLSDGVDLRDRGIRLLELANTIDDAERRRDILRIVVVGANFSGVEFAGEYQDFLRTAARSYRNIDPDEITVLLLEMAGRILNALEPELADYARRHLSREGVDIRTGTSVKEIGREFVVLTTGERLSTRIVVWCAGIAPNPLLGQVLGIPTNKQGYIECNPDLSVARREHLWAIGDIAAVMDQSGKPYAATAQNATREGTAAADNLLARLAGRPTKPFDYGGLGSFAALGCRTAVAKVFGIKIAGFPAWFMYRTVYLFKMPGWSRKVRIMMDWTADLFAKAEPVQLGIRRIVRQPDSAGEPIAKKASVR